jgi:TonB family protein
MKPLENFIGSPLAGAIGWAVLHSLWEGAAIAALLAVVLVAVRSPRVRYAAAGVAMIAVVAGFGVTLVRMMPDATQIFPRFRAPAFFAVVPKAAMDGNMSPSWRSVLAAIAPWLAPLWLLGVCLFFVQRAAACISISRLRRRGVCCPADRWEVAMAELAVRIRVSRPVRLLESCIAEVPMVLGHFRPVILMPIGLLAGLPAEQVEPILLHELAHVRRADYLVNALQRLSECLLFYHPAVWWISHVMRLERENCCDDIVVALSHRSHEYALALAALERNRHSGRQPAVAATGGTLVNRIRRLLYPKAPAGIWAPLLAVAVLTAAAAASLAAWPIKMQLLPAAALHARAQDANSLGRKVDPTMISEAADDSGSSQKVSKTVPGETDSADPLASAKAKSFTVDGATDLDANAWPAADASDSSQKVSNAAPASGTPQASQSGPPAQDVFRPQVQFTTSAADDNWLNQDVVYIITDEERATYLRLQTDDERNQFIQQFWERRNPNPGSPDNTFKDEHYRRIAYANQRFATNAGKPGWQTDRGHIYIVYGAPDNIAAAAGSLPINTESSPLTTQAWKYDHIEGVGDNLVFTFFDRSNDGDYTLAPLPSALSQNQTPATGNSSAANGSRVRMGAAVAQAGLISQTPPEYPDIARRAHLQGTVLLNAIIGKDGSVLSLDYVSGPPLLMKAAMDAVSLWKYKPVMLNGAAVEVDTQVQVVFTLNQ